MVCCMLISIHALRVESDQPPGQAMQWPKTFLSTLSVWRATLRTHRYTTDPNISIHALRVESDPIALLTKLTQVRISIHALRVESDLR